MEAYANIEALPPEILSYILEFTGQALSLAARVCKTWRILALLISPERVRETLVSQLLVSLPLLSWTRNEAWSELFRNRDFLTLAVKKGDQSVVEQLLKEREREEALPLNCFKAAGSRGELGITKLLFAELKKKADPLVAAFSCCYRKAAQFERFELLDWLEKKNGGSEGNGIQVLLGASKGGSLAAYSWALERLPREVIQERDLVRCCKRAIQGGHLTLLESLVTNLKELPQPSLLYNTALKWGRLELLEWLHGKIPAHRVVVHYASVKKLVKGGELKTLSWLLEKDLMPNSGANFLCLALERAQKEVFHWILDNRERIGFVMRDDFLLYAVKGGSLELLEEVYIQFPYRGQSHSPAFFASGRGDVKMLEWLLEKRFTLQGGCCRQAIKRGDLPLLKWLRARGAPWSKWDLRGLEFVHRKVIQWAVRNGAPITEGQKRSFIRRGIL